MSKGDGRVPLSLSDELRPRRAGLSAEQFHARSAPNNATRLSGMEWLWSGKRASVGHRRQPPPAQTGGPTMRIYIIGNDGITLCGETTPELNADEIAIGSSEELYAASLSGKRLLALWNALPGVEKRKKVGDRNALIDQLWSAIERLPEPKPQSEAKRPSTQRDVIATKRPTQGATVEE